MAGVSGIHCSIRQDVDETATSFLSRRDWTPTTAGESGGQCGFRMMGPSLYVADHTELSLDAPAVHCEDKRIIPGAMIANINVSGGQ